MTRSGGEGEGPVQVISAAADQLFLDLTPAEIAGLPRFTGEMELTNHSAGSLTSQAYVKRWIRRQETLADAAEKASIAAEWLGGRKYPLERLDNAWTLAMGTHFHDIAAGTATPRSYEFAWNDQVISLNQFASVFSSATQTVAAALNTQTAGIPVVVFNPLNVAREDVVEAKVDLPAGTKAVRVVGPDGNAVLAQVSSGKVLFLASVPSVGYTVYEVAPAAAAAEYRPPRLGIFARERALPREHRRQRRHIEHLRQVPAARVTVGAGPPGDYLRQPGAISGLEHGLGPGAAPRRALTWAGRQRSAWWRTGRCVVAVEVARETEGSRFVQTIALTAGDAGNRVEIANSIDWNTREANLKAAFPLTATNQLATYNLDIGTIQRPTAEPRKFEFPSHQWVDLTDAAGGFGATILTDCKNGSDKPRDNVIRLTLLRTPGTRGGYPDQGTQDVGHHEFVYGIAGHSGDWRHGQTDWQAYRLNQPLVAFETARHAGALGKEFSLLRISNPAIRVLAHEEGGAERRSDRAAGGDPGPPGGQRADCLRRRAHGGARGERPGAAGGAGHALPAGALAASFTAYQPRTFAVKLAPPRAPVAPVESRPVALGYDLAVATADGAKSSPGFDAQGRALAAAMLPGEIDYGGAIFKLGPAGAANARGGQGTEHRSAAGRLQPRVRAGGVGRWRPQGHLPRGRRARSS